MPGDIITIRDAKMKGRKGIQTYRQTVGAGTPVVAVIGEYESWKSRVKVYQANQHDGNQVGHTKHPTSAILMQLYRQSSLLVTG